MAINGREDILYYADFDGRDGPIIGPGDPTFARAGSRWMFDGRLYRKLMSGVPRVGTRIELTSGRRRLALDLALGNTGLLDDSVRFDISATAWTLVGGGTPSEGSTVTSIFASLPTNGEAREFSSSAGASDDAGIRQTDGSSTSSKETMVAIFEDSGQTTSRLLASDDTGTYIDIRYDWSSDSVTETTGTGVAAVKTESPKRVLLIGIGTGNGTTGRTLDYYAVHDAASETGGIHYAQAHGLAVVPGIQPDVGSPSAIPGEQFSVSPGPYRDDVVQAWYLDYIAGTLVGETGSLTRLFEVGDGSNPRVPIFERGTSPGVIRALFIDASGTSQFVDLPLGSPKPGDRIEIVYAFDPSDGNNRLIGRVENGSVSDTGASAPGSWTTPSDLGGDNRVTYNEIGSLSGARRGRIKPIRHLCALGPSMDNDPLTGGATAVMDELVDACNRITETGEVLAP